MTTTPDNPDRCIWISLPDIPSPKQLLDNTNTPQIPWLYSFGKSSIPLTAIAAKLKPQKGDLFILNNNNSKTHALNEIFVLLDSPIEKYNLTKFLLPHKARGSLLSKSQLIKLLLKYTQTDNLKSGIIRNLIDSIEIGKSTESPTPEFIISTLSVLKIFWDECYLLKNQFNNRFSINHLKFDNQLTLENLSSILDDLHKSKIISNKLDDLYPIIITLFDLLSILNKPLAEFDDVSKYTLELIFCCILNKSTINERVIFNSLCLKPKNLASSIWHSRSNIWDVIYGIEYLKNKDIHLWKKILDLTNPNKVKTKLNSNVPILVVKIAVNIPFSVMRCTRMYGEYDDIVNKITLNDNFSSNSNDISADEGFCIEEKLDGERSILHLWRDKNDSNKIFTKFFSRGHIVQKWYGSYIGDTTGIITKYLKVEWFEGINDLILDGEMITFDEGKDKLLGFQDVKTCCEMMRNYLNNGIDLTDLKIYNKLLVYDLLYLNGESLQLTTLKERKNKLLKLFEKSTDFKNFKFIQLHKWNIGYNSNDLKIAMDNIINKNSEGLVIKNWKSFYFVGKYSNQWIKLKPYYLMDFIDELDVTIIGKEGSNFICALYGGNDSEDKFKNWFISFCLLRFGLNNDILNFINDKTNGHWIKYEKYKSDIEMEEHFVKFGKLKPNYWIHPENSLVLTIKAKSMINNNNHFDNKFILDTTLRFPYCLSVRYDKEYFECDTVKAYTDKVERQNKKNPFDENEERFSKLKRFKRKTKMDITLQNVNKSFIKTIVKKDDLFKGITFCVKTDCLANGQWLQVNEINGILESHGGKIINVPIHDIHNRIIIIADRNTIAVNELRKEYNIFKFKWCEDCIRTNELVNLDPSHCLIVDDDMKRLSLKYKDEFNFNYTVKYNEKGLWENSKTLEREGYELNDEQSEKLELFFNNKKFIILGYDETNSFERNILEIQIEIHGGDIINDEKGADFIVIKSAAIEISNIYNKPIMVSNEVLRKCKYVE